MAYHFIPLAAGFFVFPLCDRCHSEEKVQEPDGCGDRRIYGEYGCDGHVAWADEGLPAVWPIPWDTSSSDREVSEKEVVPKG